MRIVMIIALLTVSLTLTFGQTISDSILMTKTFGGYQFYQGKNKLSMKQLVNTMESNDQAYELIKSARASLNVVKVISYAGGFMIGLPLGIAMGGRKPNLIMAGIGLGFIIVSIPISQNFNKKAKQAVYLYNRGRPQTTSFWDKKELRFSIVENGVGLKLCF